MLLLRGGRIPKLKTRLCCVQSPSEAQTSVCCLNTQHLRQHFLPSQKVRGFLGTCSIYTRPAPAAGAQGAPPAAAATAPPLPVPSSSCKTLGFKKTMGRSILCPALFETKMNFKAAPTPWRWRGVGGTWEAAGSRSPPGSLCFIPPPIRSVSEHFPWKSIATEVSSCTLEHRG